MFPQSLFPSRMSSNSPSLFSRRYGSVKLKHMVTLDGRGEWRGVCWRERKVWGNDCSVHIASWWAPIMSIKSWPSRLLRFWCLAISRFHNRGNQTRYVTVMTKHFFFVMHQPRSDGTRNYNRYVIKLLYRSSRLEHPFPPVTAFFLKNRDRSLVCHVRTLASTTFLFVYRQPVTGNQTRI